MVWIQVQPRMTLKDGGSSTTVKVMSTETGLTKTGSMTSPSDMVWALLKPIKILRRLRRLLAYYPIWIKARRNNRSVALPGSTRILCVRWSLTSREMIKGSS